MKEENFKKHLKENFEQKAPKEFTSKVMQNIQATKTGYEPILSKKFIVVSGFLVLALFIIIALTTKGSNPYFDFSIISNFIISNVNLLVLPFSIVLLMFLKEWFYFRIYN